MDTTHAEATVAPTVVLPSLVLPIKRKRGRPRKYPLPETGLVVSAPVVSRVETPPALDFQIAEADGGIIRPTLDTKFWIDPDTLPLLGVIDHLSTMTPQNVLLTGLQGSGKTTMAVWFAAKYKRRLFMVNCATIRETKDWFGYRDAKDGSLFWHKSDFVRAIEEGNCVILLDEFNRLHTTLHNSLYPLLDSRRSSFLEELGEIVKVGPGTVFFATCNIGFSHMGTHTLDSAIEDRFGLRIEIEFPPANEESQILQSKTGIEVVMANKLAQFGRDIRRKALGNGATLTRVVSTRQLLQTAIIMQQFAKRSIDQTKAFDYTILPSFSKDGGKDSEQAQVLQVIQGIFKG